MTTGASCLVGSKDTSMKELHEEVVVFSVIRGGSITKTRLVKGEEEKEGLEIANE